MEDFNWNNTLSKVGGLAGLAGTLAGAYYNVPQAQSNVPYLKQAALVGNTLYGTSTMKGLLSDYRRRRNTPKLSRRDLYDPTTGEMFGSMFGSGLAAYAASLGLTSDLKGAFGKGTFGEISSEDSPTTSDLIHSTTSKAELFNYGAQAATNPLEKQVLEDLAQVAALAEINPNPDNGYTTLGWELNNTGFEIFPTTYALGGNLDGGSALATGIDLSNAAIGIGLGYAGIKNQLRIADLRVAQYNLQRDYANLLSNQRFNNAVIDTKNNMFNNQALLMMAFGGDMSTQGTDFPLQGSYREINEGGSHEANPLGGVQQGISTDGQPNLVEEGEVIWDDYVFSNSRRKDKKHKKNPTPDIPLPEELLEKYKSLRENMTFADAAKRLSEEAKERPNDPISQLGLQIFMSELRDAQEMVKQEQQAKELKKLLNNMSPLELMNFQAMLQQSMQQQPQMEQQQMMQAAPEDMAMAQMPQEGFAQGGHLFATGGKRGRALLNMLSLPQLLELARAFNNYDNSLNTTNIPPIIDFILENTLGDNKYNSIQDSIRKAQTYKLLDKRPGYTKTTIDNTDWNTFFNILNSYGESKKRSNLQYRYHEDPRLNFKGMTTELLEQNEDYKKFTTYIKNHSNDGNVLKYLHILDESINTETGAETLFDDEGNLKNNWKTIFDQRRNDLKGGIYHFFNTLKGKTQGERTIYRLDGLEIQVDDPEKLSKFLSDPKISYETEFDELGNLMTTKYVDLKSNAFNVDESRTYIDDEKQLLLPTWQRYAPVVGDMLAALPSQKENYDTQTPFVSPDYEPIGDYLPYNPVDTQRYLNGQNQQSAQQLAAIMNASGANKNIAMAQAANAEYQRQLGIADILNTAEAMNFARRAQVGDFNRGTNLFNALAFNQRELAAMALNNLNLNQDLQNLTMRHIVDNEYDAAKSATINAALESLAGIGTENFYQNQINGNKAYYYANKYNPFALGQTYYPGTTLMIDEDGNPIVAAFGGKLLTKKNNRRR